jgi:hypothetical protein
MKTFLLAVAFLLIGAAVGGFLAINIGAGMGAGAGIVVGSQAGACLAMEAAKDKGMLTAEQIDEVLNDAIAKISGKVELPPDAKLLGSEADCARMVAELQKSVQESKTDQAQ